MSLSGSDGTSAARSNADLTADRMRANAPAFTAKFFGDNTPVPSQGQTQDDGPIGTLSHPFRNWLSFRGGIHKTRPYHYLFGDYFSETLE
jgi:hypothetical protein